MSKKTFLSSAVVVFLATFLAVGLFVAQESVVPAAHASTILHFVEHYKNVIVDLPPKGDSMGDLNPFADPIYDAANKKQVGSESGSCIRTSVGKLWECNWTIYLKGGQISVEGPSYDKSNDSVLAIVGGTGTYKNTRGELKVHILEGNGSLASYTLYLS